MTATEINERKDLDDALPPSFSDLAESSKWIREIDGLYDWFMQSEISQPIARKSVQRHAKALSRPTLNPHGFETIGRVIGRATVVTGKWATDLPNLFYRKVVFGEDSPTPKERLIERSQHLVKAGGSSMVKLGQFVSTAKGLLPDEIVESFAWCRDSVDPLSGDVVISLIESELNVKIDEIFETFEKEPMAAASIAQVHRATLKGGCEVVVKVQRPGLKEQFCKDLRAMALLAYGAEFGFKGARLANLSGFVELFASLVLEELDFKNEALNMVELGLAAEHAEADFVVFPRPLPPYITSKVLIMERLRGVSYADADWTKVPKEEREKLLRLVIQGVLEHTLVYGVFHGDLHAGNVLADTDGKLGLIDYGIVGRLSVEERAALVRFMVGVGLNDTSLQLAALKEFGAVPEECDTEELAKKMDISVLLPESVTQENLADQVTQVIRFLGQEGFRLPTPLVLFFKNLLYLNGFAAAVSPGTDLLAEIGPIFEYFKEKYPKEMELIAGPL